MTVRRPQPFAFFVAATLMACAGGEAPAGAPRADSGHPPDGILLTDGGATVDSGEPFPTFDSPPPDGAGHADVDLPDAPPAARAEQLALGLLHTCARLADGTVRCFGDGRGGELGDGRNIDRSFSYPVFGLDSVAEVASANMRRRTCARKVDGTVRCWGAFDDLLTLPDTCSFGDSTGLHACSRTPTPVTMPGSVLEVSLGGQTCVVRNDGTVRCLGDTANFFDAPDGLTDIAEVAVGDDHACARRDDGTVYCWGQGSLGQLGFDGSDICVTDVGEGRCSKLARLVTGLTGVARLGAGDSFTCAMIVDGTVQCWGANFAGQLGYGAVDNCTKYAYPCGIRPRAIDVSDVIDIAIGGYHGCVLRSDHTVACWGNNDEGQLGYDTKAVCGGGAMISCSIKPEPVVGLTDVVEIAAGGRHTCARTSDGSTYCWGANDQGQLGDGTTDSRNRPTLVKW